MRTKFKSIALTNISLILFHFLSLSQKTFSAKTIVADKEGLLEYAYNEDKSTGKYIKNGFYKFSSDLKNNYGSCKTNITGQYKTGLKDGAWIYSCSYKDWGSLEMLLDERGFVTGTVSISCKYKNGVESGAWIYSSSLKHRAVTKYNDGRTVYGQFINLNDFIISLSLKDGVYNGICSYKDNLNDKSSMKGNFIDGCPDGQIQLSNKSFTSILKFSRNFLYATTERYTTGEIKYQFPQGVITRSVFEKVASGEVTLSNAKANHVTFDEKGFNSGYSIFAGLLAFDFSTNSEFNFFIEGDLSYVVDEDNNLKINRGKNYYSIGTTIASDEQDEYFEEYLNKINLTSNALTIIKIDSLEKTIKLFGNGRKLTNNIDTRNAKGYKLFKADINGDLKEDLIIQYQFEPNEMDLKKYGASAAINLGAIVIYTCDQTSTYRLAYTDKNFTNGEGLIKKVENGIIYFHHINKKLNEDEVIKLLFSKERLVEQK